MRNHLLPSLWIPHRDEMDHHIELSPTLFIDSEGWVLKRLLLALFEGFVENVGRFFEAVGGKLVAVGTHEVDAHGPFAEGKDAFFGGLIVAGRCVSGAREGQGEGGLREALTGDELDGTFDLVDSRQYGYATRVVYVRLGSRGHRRWYSRPAY